MMPPGRKLIVIWSCVGLSIAMLLTTVVVQDFWM